MVNRYVVHFGDRKNRHESFGGLGGLLVTHSLIGVLALDLVSQCVVILSRLIHIAHVLLILLFVATLTFESLTRVCWHLGRFILVDQTTLHFSDCSLVKGLLRVTFLTEDRLLRVWSHEAIGVCDVCIEEVIRSCTSRIRCRSLSHGCCRQIVLVSRSRDHVPTNIQASISAIPSRSACIASIPCREGQFDLIQATIGEVISDFS